MLSRLSIRDVVLIENWIWILPADCARLPAKQGRENQFCWIRWLWRRERVRTVLWYVTGLNGCPSALNSFCRNIMPF